MFTKNKIINILGKSLSDNNPKTGIIVFLVFVFFMVAPSIISAKNPLTGFPFFNGILLNNRANQEPGKGNITGTIKDINGNILVGANVIILDSSLGDATDIIGNFSFSGLPTGDYKLQALYIGYKTEPVTVKVNEGKTTTVEITLKPYSFMIGGIEVIGEKNLIPDDPETKTIITSGEIEHYQALSIKDVLDLVPGIQKSENPDLDKTSRAALRSNENYRTSAFGTLFIIDNVPVSNNANLQFENNYGSFSNLGGGIDLRTIPADNIEMIEVISGLPSVRYGDMTEGVVKIRTKTGYQPVRLKIKSNPGTREGNFSGGLLFGDNGLSYNLNLARNERDRRITGDEYSRLTAQAVMSNILLEGSFNVNHKITGQKIFDEREPKGDILRTRNYDRGYSLGYSSWGKLNFGDHQISIEYNAFVNLNAKNSLKEKLVESDYRVLPNGDTVSNYIGKVETRGREWNLGGRFEFEKKFSRKNIIHNLLAGTDIKYDVNTGDGIVFDTTLSYYGPESGVRPYRFNDLPGQLLLSFYAEDKISGHLFFDYILQFGFRYEMYRPYKLNLKGLWGDGNLVNSHNGTFFNPRISLLLSFSKNQQVRFSAGRSSKAPALSTLFPRYEVFNWRNPLDSISYHLYYDLKVPDLHGIIETQYEAAYDLSFNDLLGVSISVYYKERKNENEGDGAITSAGQEIPVFHLISDGNGGKNVHYFGKYKHSENLGYSFSKGIEFRLKSVEIKSLNLSLQVNGSYNYFNSSRNGITFYPNPEAEKGQYPNYKPSENIDTLIGFVWSPPGKWRSSLQLNYYLNYTLEKLGIWLTLRAEQMIFEKYQTYNLIPVEWSMLDEEDRNYHENERGMVKFGNKWLLNINISKSLFDGAEVSFYVNNFLDNSAYGRNPKLFYGIEFSSILDRLW